MFSRIAKVRSISLGGHEHTMGVTGTMGDVRNIPISGRMGLVRTHFTGNRLADRRVGARIVSFYGELDCRWV